MEKLLEILSEIKENVDFEAEKALIDDGIIDSLDLMQLISEIESEFDVEVEMDNIVPENFNSAEAMMAMIERLQDEA